MTDDEIHAVIAKCGAKNNATWDALVSQFSKTMVALSDRLSEDDLYSLLEVALACYLKGYDDINAVREKENRQRRVAQRSSDRSAGERQIAVDQAHPQLLVVAC